jgi:hypothetical protein
LEAGTRYGQKMQQQQRQELQTADPMTKFMYALKAKESKRQYTKIQGISWFSGAIGYNWRRSRPVPTKYEKQPFLKEKGQDPVQIHKDYGYSASKHILLCYLLLARIWTLHELQILTLDAIFQLISWVGSNDENQL